MEDSPEAFLVALRNVAEARSMTKVAEDAEVNRENLYRVLSKDGNPRWDTINSVLKALGMTLLPTNSQATMFSGPTNQATMNTTTSIIVAGASTVNVTAQVDTGKIAAYTSTFGKKPIQLQVAQGNSQLALVA
jgi:probable addiction module antidote protein